MFLFFVCFLAGRISFFSASLLVGFRECWSGPTSTDQHSDNPGCDTCRHVMACIVIVPG